MALPISVLVENFTNTYTRRIIPPTTKTKVVDYRNRGDSYSSSTSCDEKRQLLTIERHNSIDSFLSNYGNKQMNP